MNSFAVAEVAGRSPVRSRVQLSAEQTISAPVLAVDAVLIVLVSLISGTAFHLINYRFHGDTAAFAATGAIAATLFCGAIRIQGMQNRRADFSAGGRVRTAIVIWSLSILFLLVLAFTLKISSAFSRGTVFTFYFMGLVLVPLSRLWTPRVLAQWSLTNAYRGTEILLVSPFGHAGAKELRAILQQQGCQSIRVLEYQDDHASQEAWLLERKGFLQAIFDAALDAAPGPIYVIGGKLAPLSVMGLLNALRLIPRAIYLVPEDHVAELLRYDICPVGGAPAVETQKAPLTTFERFAKRSIDILGSASGLLLCAPLFAVVAAAVKLSSRGPVFFCQMRHGYRGRPFRIIKFRTMTVMEDGEQVTQATRNDRRITRIGAFLRKTSIDELPQLWNVFRGDMSLIGPRPHAIAHDKLFSDLIANYEVRQHVKPGITGWAQVNGFRGETPNIDLMYRRIEMDLWYATNCSLALDIQILFRTVFEVIRQRNAY